MISMCISGIHRANALLKIDMRFQRLFHQITVLLPFVYCNDTPTKLNIDTQNDAILEAGDTFSKVMIFCINSFNFKGVRFEIVRVESGLKLLNPRPKRIHVFS